MNGGGYVGGFFIGVHMPPRIPRACRKRGCAGTTTDSSGYCDKHRGEGWVQHQRGLSRHQRGYGSKWDAIRARILKRDNHLCQNCLRNGRAVEARKLWTTSFRKLMVARMQTVTCRVCAGPVIKQKQRANASIDNSSHL